MRLRNFAVLLFGRETQRFIPGGYVVYTRYSGTEKTNQYLRSKHITGTLINQLDRLLEILEAENSIFYDKADLKHPNAYKYPELALKEALVNALAHRDYEDREPVRITAFDDRIEFLSPGKLPFGVDEEEFRHGLAYPRWRNQMLAWILGRLNFAQGLGQGVKTIFKSLRDAGYPEPDIKLGEVYVQLVIHAHPRHMVFH